MKAPQRMQRIGPHKAVLYRSGSRARNNKENHAASTLEKAGL
jgi:hypothetical protein